MSEFNCDAATCIVDYFAAHLRSATQVDAIGTIDQMALLCKGEDARQGQSLMRCLSRSVAAFVAGWMEFIPADDKEFVLVEFVSTGSRMD
ncbi:hypothetical protein C5O79_32385 [Burkholderia sp. SRS-25]|nr:hypothetical protein C5O79_32385 [Burkholderia sp. SRS-25]